MNPLIVKGVVFGLLLACAALWDMKEREIPDLIPAMILVCFDSDVIFMGNAVYCVFLLHLIQVLPLSGLRHY